VETETLDVEFFGSSGQLELGDFVPGDLRKAASDDQ